MTHPDKLDTLFSYLLEQDKNNLPNSVSNKFGALMNGLMQDEKSFWFVFDNIPEQVKADLFGQNKSFKNNFLQMLYKSTDEKFNYYFFHEVYLLKNTIPIENIRYCSLSRPSNLELKQYLESIDKPQTLPDLVNLLSTLDNFDKYECLLEIVKENDALLEKKYLVKNQKSLEKLYIIINNVYNKKGLSYTFDFAEKIKIDLVKRQYGKPITYKKFDILNSKAQLTKQDIAQLDKFFLTDQNEMRYNILAENFEAEDVVYSMLQIAKKTPEHINYFWSIYKEFLDHVIDMYNMKNIKDKDPIKVLKILSKNYRNALIIGQTSLVDNNSQELIKSLEKVLLLAKLNENLPEIATSTIRKKI